MSRTEKILAAVLAVLVGAAAVGTAIFMHTPVTVAALMGGPEGEDFTPNRLTLYVYRDGDSTGYELADGEEELSELARLLRETAVTPASLSVSQSIGPQLRYTVFLDDWSDGHAVFYPDGVSVTEDGWLYNEEGRRYAISPEAHEKILAELQSLEQKAGPIGRN